MGGKGPGKYREQITTYSYKQFKDTALPALPMRTEGRKLNFLFENTITINQTCVYTDASRSLCFTSEAKANKKKINDAETSVCIGAGSG